MKSHRRNLRIAWWLIGILFLLMNLVAFAHAYRFTHFTAVKTARTKDAKDLSMAEKMKTLLTGVDNPRPSHTARPARSFDNVAIGAKSKIMGWRIKVNNSKGTVILFHGYAGEKSSLLKRADEFLSLGYSVLLIDFLGSGDSDGSSTTIGFKEADQVKTCYDFVKKTGEPNICLFGTSMGAAAIMKSIYDNSLNPDAIVLECPFGSLYKTVCARFDLMGVPCFPMAGLLTFWGGVQHGYWAFSHNPSTYAERIACPVLLLFGRQDDRVSIEEPQSIYSNLKGSKTLKIYQNNGHDVFSENEEAWRRDVADFMTKY